MGGGGLVGLAVGTGTSGVAGGIGVDVGSKLGVGVDDGCGVLLLVGV